MEQDEEEHPSHLFHFLFIYLCVFIFKNKSSGANSRLGTENVITVPDLA